MVASVDAFCTEQARRMLARPADWIEDGGTSVTLTFDDGPHKTLTPKLLAILGTLNIKAVFFVCGNNLSANPGILKSIRDSGHQLGNHSFTHANLATLGEAAVKSELDRTQALIGALGTQKKYFRPPYGSLNATVKKVAKDAGMTIILWDVDTKDWKHKSPAWVDEGLKQIRKGARNVVLMHDIHAATVESVAGFVTKVKARFPGVSFPLLA